MLERGTTRDFVIIRNGRFGFDDKRNAIDPAGTQTAHSAK